MHIEGIIYSRRGGSSRLYKYSKVIFNHLKRVGDKRPFLVLWFLGDDKSEMISVSNQFPKDLLDIRVTGR